MIYRIVKMSFEHGKEKDFLAVFEASKDKIRAFEGCEHLQLWQDRKASNVFFTYSHWRTEADLENYRHSALFRSTWAKTKIHFNAKPEAWSVDAKFVLN